MNFEKSIELAEFFKIFGDSTRIRIIDCLANGEKKVSEIVDELEMTQPAVSHQLKILRISKVVKYRKVGKEVIYSLDDDHVSDIFKKGVEHIEENK